MPDNGSERRGCAAPFAISIAFVYWAIVILVCGGLALLLALTVFRQQTEDDPCRRPVPKPGELAECARREGP